MSVGATLSHQNTSGRSDKWYHEEEHLIEALKTHLANIFPGGKKSKERENDEKTEGESLKSKEGTDGKPSEENMSSNSENKINFDNSKSIR